MNWPLVILINVMMVWVLVGSIRTAVSAGKVFDLYWAIGFASALLILDVVVIQQWLLFRKPKTDNSQPDQQGGSDVLPVDKK